MRTILEPDWETAERLYPTVKKLIEEYAKFVDEYGDGCLHEYKNVEHKLHEITGKDMEQYNLWEWWEGEGLEVLSFRISLPEPNTVQDITKDELLEVVKKIKPDVFQPNNGDSFKDIFGYHIADFYRELLKRNFKRYKPEYFNRQKGKNGKYFEYSAEEISEKIWG